MNDFFIFLTQNPWGQSILTIVIQKACESGFSQYKKAHSWKTHKEELAFLLYKCLDSAYRDVCTEFFWDYNSHAIEDAISKIWHDNNTISRDFFVNVITNASEEHIEDFMIPKAYSTWIQSFRCHLSFCQPLINYYNERALFDEVEKIPLTQESVLEYQILNNDTIEITKCNHKITGSYDIPEKIEGLSVTQIKDAAFAYQTELIDISIPDTVNYIGKYAFRNCEELQSIKLPTSIKVIGLETFEQCRHLQRIQIPEGVERIMMASFAYCSNLEEIILPTTLKTIESHAFHYCHNLKTIALPPSVEYIAEYVFNSLHDITIQVVPNSYAHKYVKNNNAFSQPLKYEYIEGF